MIGAMGDSGSEMMPFHEFYLDDFEPRSHYLPLWEHIRRTGQSALATKAHEAHLALQTEGVTFTVYDDDAGVERVWPFDLIPRIITAGEWTSIEAGLKQRIRALNLFLHDLYHDRKVVSDGVVPPELVLQGKDFIPELSGIDPARDIYTHIGGTDLIRDESGRYLVLEDNLRTPSGVSYMIENRVIERHVLPEFFAQYRVRRVEHYPALLLQALRSLSPRWPNEAEVVLLTPGPYNSAYFEHTFLAKEMGVELVEGRDLLVKNDIVYMKTTKGLRQIDVVYRRVDDAFLDPLCFRADSIVGVAGIINSWRAGKVAIANAPGAGIADDKAVYTYVPDIIRYYLGERPISGERPHLPNVSPRRESFRSRQSPHHGRQRSECVGRPWDVDGSDFDAGPADRVCGTHRGESAKLYRATGGWLVTPRLLPRRRARVAPHRPAPVRHLWRGYRSRAGRTHPCGADQGLAGRQLVAGRR